MLVFVNLALKGGTYIYYFQYYLSEAALAGFLDASGFNGFIGGVNALLSGWGLSGFTWPQDPATSASPPRSAWPSAPSCCTATASPSPCCGR
ncbi:hypothetical protein NB693_24705 [Pantoea ananatis]|uniref:hypothetical protein n=1 Tax=Pantoea ananas TaxID=553 RepID=UPI00221F05C4|nr:hypothetical protein [Pantoea ananatis]